MTLMDYDKEDYRMLYNERDEADRGPGLPFSVWLILALAAVAIALS